jgi:hypothetical protein
MVWRVKQVRSLQEIDRDIAALRKDEQTYAHTKGHRFSPIVDDERMATLKALGDAGLKKYKALILPKPENKNSVCAACYVFYAKDSTQAYERGKEVFVSEFARYGVTAEDFDAEYDIAITSGENVK